MVKPPFLSLFFISFFLLLNLNNDCVVAMNIIVLESERQRSFLPSCNEVVMLR